MSWRLASRLSVVTLALLVVIVVAFWGLRTNNTTAGATPSTNQSGLQGTDLGSTPAPDFRLTDQSGRPVALSQFRGEPVVLTFMYTRCPDVCPLTAEKLHQVQLLLGRDAAHVEMLAVSIDPRGDTRTAALKFSQTHKLTTNWHYLIGTHDQLSPVWNAYSVYAQDAMENKITHTDALYLIDKQGRERVFFADDFTNQQLTSDLRVLLTE
ncbi:MAG TPA: SCO family protein [Ktedonobacteraceae bacterium]|jgi:protein SCO1/2